MTARPIITHIYQGTGFAGNSLGSLYLTTSGDQRVARVVRSEWMSQAEYDAGTPQGNTLYIIGSSQPRGRCTAHRWPLAADDATAFYLGDTLVTGVDFGTGIGPSSPWSEWVLAMTTSEV